MAHSLKGRHLRTLRDLSVDEIWQILELSRDLKARLLSGERSDLLAGRTLGLIFMKPSLRTLVSFQVAMTQLGGTSLFLGPEMIGLGTREPVEDIAKVLSGYLDGIMARVFEHHTIDELTQHATVPVINGLSDYAHPCQVLADLLTIQEHKRTLKGRTLTFIGDGFNMANSLLFGAAKVGMNVRLAIPQGEAYALSDDVMALAQQDAAYTGSKFEVTSDVEAAAQGADVLYTDVWTSMGQDKQREQRLQDFAGYQINAELMARAHPDAIVMHCLPAHYGEEITHDVAHGPQSVIFEQAHNRLHAQKGVIAALLR